MRYDLDREPYGRNSAFSDASDASETPILMGVQGVRMGSLGS